MPTRPLALAGVLALLLCLLFPKNILASQTVLPDWSLNVGSDYSPRIFELVQDEDDNVYIAKELSLVKVSPQGTILWTYNLGGSVSYIFKGSPVVSQNYALFVAGAGGADAIFLNKENGSLIAKVELVKNGSWPYSPLYYSKPVISKDEKFAYVYLTGPGSLFAIETEGYTIFGKTKDDYVFGGPFYAPQTLSLGGVMYIGTLHGNALAIYPYSYAKSLGNMSFMYFSVNPTPSSTGSQSLMGPAIDYDSRRTIWFDFYNPTSTMSQLHFINLGDNLILKSLDLHPTLKSNTIPIQDRFGNTFVLAYDASSTLGNFSRVFKVSPSMEVSKEITLLKRNSLVTSFAIDNEGYVYIPNDKAYKFTNNLEENTVFDHTTNGDTSSLLSSLTLSKDQESLFVLSRNGNLYKFSTGFEDPGCIKKYYCNSVPKHRPIIFVHGLGGKPDDWMPGGNKEGLRNLILETYRQDDPEFPGNWAQAYHYGYDNLGNYDYQGDIIEISKGLQEDIAKLSYEFKEAGGDGKVDIVGFSLGGQVIREYLASMVGEMDDQNDDREHKVRKAIICGSPNMGSEYVDFKYTAGTTLGYFQRFLDIGWNAFFQATNNNGQPLNVNSKAVSQIKSDSSFMTRVANRYATDIEYSLLYGDASTTVKQKMFGVDLGGKVSAGDTLVSSRSASNLPNIEEVNKYKFDEDFEATAKMNIVGTQAEITFEQFNPESLKYVHMNFMQQEDVQQKVLDILLQ